MSAPGGSAAPEPERPPGPSRRELRRLPPRPLALASSGLHLFLTGAALVSFLAGLVSLTVFGVALTPPWVAQLPMTRWSLPLSLIVGIPLLCELAQALLSRWRYRSYGRARLTRVGLRLERGFPPRAVTIPYEQLEILEAAPNGIRLATAENPYRAWRSPLFVPTESSADHAELLACIEQAKLGDVEGLPTLPPAKGAPEQWPRRLPVLLVAAAGTQWLLCLAVSLSYPHVLALLTSAGALVAHFKLCWLPWWRRKTQPYHTLLVQRHLMHQRWEWSLDSIRAVRRVGGWLVLDLAAEEVPLRLWVGQRADAGVILRASLPGVSWRSGGPLEPAWDRGGADLARVLIGSLTVAGLVAMSWRWGPALLG